MPSGARLGQAKAADLIVWIHTWMGSGLAPSLGLAWVGTIGSCSISYVTLLGQTLSRCACLIKQAPTLIARANACRLFLRATQGSAQSFTCLIPAHILPIPRSGSSYAFSTGGKAEAWRGFGPCPSPRLGRAAGAVCRWPASRAPTSGAAAPPGCSVTEVRW